MSESNLTYLTTVDNLVEGGFILAVDGPSGTGKSTVCRRIAQAAAPASLPLLVALLLRRPRKRRRRRRRKSRMTTWALVSLTSTYHLVAANVLECMHTLPYLHGVPTVLFITLIGA